MRLSTITKYVVCFLLWGTFTATAASLNEDPLHDKAVNTAREGNPREGLAILQSILDKDPDNYAVRRDFVIIATWAGDCDLAELKRLYGDKIVLKGNLHTTRVMLHGTCSDGLTT